MKINPQRPLEAQDAYLRVQKTGGKDALERTKKADLQKQNDDRVELSDKAKKVDALKKAVEAIPNVRVDKVQSLRKAIQEGTYRIDPERIAQKMLDEI